jgi:hypothetical protein
MQHRGCDMSSVDTHVADWLMLIRAEYLEIQGLSLTKQQVERLWGLDAVTSGTLLATRSAGRRQVSETHSQRRVRACRRRVMGMHEISRRPAWS